MSMKYHALNEGLLDFSVGLRPVYWDELLDTRWGDYLL